MISLLQVADCLDSQNASEMSPAIEKNSVEFFKIAFEQLITLRRIYQVEKTDFSSFFRLVLENQWETVAWLLNK